MNRILNNLTSVTGILGYFLIISLTAMLVISFITVLL